MRIAPFGRAAALALLAAGAIGRPAPVQAGDWIADTSVGCRVWNPHPQSNETIRWSGACADGLAQGRGAAQWFRDNLPFETDEGEWHVGRQTGYGTQVWPSGRFGERVGTAPAARRFLLQRQPRIGFDAISGGSGKPRLRGGDGGAIGLTGLHVQPRLVENQMTSRSDRQTASSCGTNPGDNASPGAG